MKLSILIALILGFTSILFGCSFFWNKFNEPDYEQNADAITARTAKKVKAEKNLILIGTGGGMMFDIKRMAMSFEYHQEVDIIEARRLLVYCVEEYLAAINADEKVRLYLHDYPFTVKNIEISLFFSRPDQHGVPLGGICSADLIKGNIFYHADNANTYTLVELKKESYSEAVQIVKATFNTDKK